MCLCVCKRAIKVFSFIRETRIVNLLVLCPLRPTSKDRIKQARYPVFPLGLTTVITSGPEDKVGVRWAPSPLVSSCWARLCQWLAPFSATGFCPVSPAISGSGVCTEDCVRSQGGDSHPQAGEKFLEPVFPSQPSEGTNASWSLTSGFQDCKKVNVSISASSTSADSTNCGSKIFGEKKSQKFPKSKTCVCRAPATIYIVFILYQVLQVI